MSGESFASNALAFHATVRNLEIVGEAAKRLPDEAMARMPEVDWLARDTSATLLRIGTLRLILRWCGALCRRRSLR